MKLNPIGSTIHNQKEGTLAILPSMKVPKDLYTCQFWAGPKRESKASLHAYLSAFLFDQKISTQHIVVGIMAVRVVEFSNGGYKIRKIFA